MQNGTFRVLEVAPGYYSSTDNSLNTFKCVSAVDCPGGTPGTCGGDREGIVCAECPAGKFWNKVECKECGVFATAGWFVGVIMVLVGLILAYYFLNGQVTAKASTLFSTTCGIGMTINLLQSLGIIGTMTAARNRICLCSC